MNRALRKCINVADFAKLARRKVPRPIMDFVDGGGEDESTLDRNRASFGDWGLVPSVMADVSAPSALTQIFGLDLAWPFLVAPTGMPGLLHPDGEIGIARAAAAVGALYCLSTMATRTIEEVAAATKAPKVFQLYLFRDRGISRELIQRARHAGYAALMLTVDVQVPANRERDRRSGMIIPPKFTTRTMFDFSLHPFWCWNMLRRPMKLANFDGKIADPGVPLLEFINTQYDPSITWSDLEWVAKEWGGPLAVKGIMAPDDAKSAVEHGADAVILSNHGGRQLDGGAAPLDLLPSAVERVDGRAQIILDGGIRRGTDMLKAIALGAAGCMAGRIALWGLGAGGEEGATAALRALRTEFQRDLALLGVTSVAQIGAKHLVRLHSSGEALSAIGN